LSGGKIFNNSLEVIAVFIWVYYLIFDLADRQVP